MLSLPGETGELTSVTSENPVTGFRQDVQGPTGEQSCNWAEAARRGADNRKDSARSLQVTTFVVNPVDRARALDF